MRGILVVGAHPDDETFGCGGTIALHSEKGYPVDTMCLTCSGEERESELSEAMDELGVSKPIIWNNKEIAVNSRNVRKLADVIVQKHPKILITHIPYDYHREHKLTYELVKEAIEWAGHYTIYEDAWLVKRFLLMEVNTLISQPHIFVDITDFIDKKVEAIQKFDSQLAKFSSGYYRKFSLKKAELRGVQGNCKYAEAFLEVSIPKHSPFYPVKATSDLLCDQG